MKIIKMHDNSETRIDVEQIVLFQKKQSVYNISSKELGTYYAIEMLLRVMSLEGLCFHIRNERGCGLELEYNDCVKRDYDYAMLFDECKYAYTVGPKDKDNEAPAEEQDKKNECASPYMLAARRYYCTKPAGHKGAHEVDFAGGKFSWYKGGDA